MIDIGEALEAAGDADRKAYQRGVGFPDKNAIIEPEKYGACVVRSDRRAEDAAPQPRRHHVAVPPDVYAPFPVDPFNVKLLASGDGNHPCSIGRRVPADDATHNGFSTVEAVIGYRNLESGWRLLAPVILSR